MFATSTSKRMNSNINLSDRFCTKYFLDGIFQDTFQVQHREKRGYRKADLAERENSSSNISERRFQLQRMTITMIRK